MRRLWPLVVPLLLLAVISMPAVAHLATLSLESGYDPRERTPDAEAVVVFGAGLYVPEGPRLRAELSEDGLRRCLHAARLYGAGSPCPVVVSGGKVDPDEPGPTEAAAMRDLLVRLGVRESDIVVEDRSRTTYENAVESAKLLKERDIGRVVLVVDALDMPRARGAWKSRGSKSSRRRATTGQRGFGGRCSRSSRTRVARPAFNGCGTSGWGWRGTGCAGGFNRLIR